MIDLYARAFATFLALNLIIRGWRLAAFSTLLTGLMLEFLVKALPLGAVMCKR